MGPPGTNRTRRIQANKKGWRGRGEWREEWGEQLVGRVEPAVFVLDIDDKRVRRVPGLAEHGVAASGPVWAPIDSSSADSDSDSDALVCPVWRSNIDNFDNTSRRLGLVFCFNRPSAAYLAHVPLDPTSDAEVPADFAHSVHSKRHVAAVHTRR